MSIPQLLETRLAHDLSNSDFFAYVRPTPTSSPAIVGWSTVLADQLGISLHDGNRADIAQWLSGNLSDMNVLPVATRYGGHQFGHWAYQLGDGRALLLGELVNQNGVRQEIQLKGAGMTPFSRHADGRAVLRSALREFICSEAMHFLNIPTTRALACLTTGDSVVRDILYDGNPEAEPGAITVRVAPSFLRFGHFEIYAFEDRREDLRRLMDFTLRHYYPHLPSGTEGALPFFAEIVERTMDLMVHWQRVGFVHGVMNTDNMSVLGLTIDYGPYGWMDVYDPDWTPNTTDREGRRYRFGHQPHIALWNLCRLGDALVPLGLDAGQLSAILTEQQDRYIEKYLGMRLMKLGLFGECDLNDFEFHAQLIRDLDAILISGQVDMTMFYRLLAEAQIWADGSTGHASLGVSGASSAQIASAVQTLAPSFHHADDSVLEKLAAWLLNYAKVLELDNLKLNQSPGSAPISRSVSITPFSRKEKMNAINPYFIPRNYIVQEILDELAEGKSERLQQVMKALENPYSETEFSKAYFTKRPDWAATRVGCSQLSCSS
ncbi:MAG: YdiU family protein [Bdellovibrionales bacterium]